MRRDDDLMRELMLRLEALPMRRGGIISIEIEDAADPSEPFSVPGYDAAQIEYHLRQIAMSGFIDQGGEKGARAIGFRCLTPAGHDFVNAVREPKVWTETKSRAATIGGATLGMLRDLAVAVLKGEASKHGIPIG